jgi:hypothetical protein
VTLSIVTCPAGAALFGKLITVAHDGIANFTNVTLHTAGDYTLSAAVGSVSGVSDSFNVSAGAASKMIFTQPPADTTENTIFDVQVELLDRYNNVAATDDSTAMLTLATNPAGAALSGLSTAMFSNGLASFDGLSLNAAGTYTLLLTDGKLELTSPAFQIT